MTDPRHSPDALGALAATEAPHTPTRGAPQASGAWQPGYQLDGDSGELTTTGEPGDGSPDWDAIFAAWNLDPNDWKVVDGTLRVNAWEGPTTDGYRIFRQYKAQIKRRVAAHGVPIDPTLERLCVDWPEPTGDASSSGAFVVCAADWQVGGHGGADAFVDRFHESLVAVEERARWAVDEGCHTLLLLLLGDMIEGVGGQYEAQRYEVCLDLREQIRLVRHAEAKMLATLAPLFASTTAVAVPGNHGRRTRKVETTFEDNDDLAAFEVVAELLHASGEAERHSIEFVLPDEKLVALVDAAGTLVLAAHGDQVQGSPNKLVDWWHKVGFTRWGDADAAHMLVTGHRHHLRVEEVAEDRTLIVCPTLGGESRWFAELGGGTSNPGTLTFTAGNGHWDHLRIC